MVPGLIAVGLVNLVSYIDHLYNRPVCFHLAMPFSFISCSNNVFQMDSNQLYFTLVRPHLEYMYAVAEWDPYTDKNISSIERIQRQAARFVTNTYDRESSVSQLLNSLGWTRTTLFNLLSQDA